MPCNIQPQLIKTLTVDIASSEGAAMLSPDSLVSLSLDDVSLADAPAVSLATSQLLLGGPLRLGLALSYDEARLHKGRDYALSVSITHNGELLFINTQQHAFDPEQVDARPLVIVEPVANPSPTPGIHGGNLIDQATQGIHGGNLMD
ncbi:YbaY family lipoprotein [Pseudomonas cremoricolorata]|uniref:YbaY family lipoprotein n=1 Tax=Pseudomonas cremoricolorata TaxID=157783 RepID=UPI00041BB57B|nr:YbaY family lipoprotein [Pseudomonas cremoricolorata]